MGRPVWRRSRRLPPVGQRTAASLLWSAILGAAGGGAPTPTPSSVGACWSPGRLPGLQRPYARTVPTLAGSTGCRTRRSNAAAVTGQSLVCRGPASVEVPVTIASSHGRRRRAVRATRTRERARYGRAALPVPTGARCPPQSGAQRAGGTRANRGGLCTAGRPGARSIRARAATGTSPSARAGSPGGPSADRPPPGTREWTCGGERPSRLQVWSPPSMPSVPPRTLGAPARVCPAAAARRTRSVERLGGGLRATALRPAGKGQGTSTCGTGSRNARWGASHGCAVSCWQVGPGRFVPAWSRSWDSWQASQSSPWPPRAAVRHAARACMARRGLGRRRAPPGAREAGPGTRTRSARAPRGGGPCGA